jgi:excisionase family DNA binding protein
VITPDPILTAGEVAADLRCSRAHVHKLINGAVAGVPPLPAIRMGRRVVVRRSTLERWKAQVENAVAGATLEASPNVDTADALRSEL